MDKQAILSLLIKPSDNEAMFSEIVKTYLANIKCSKDYAIMTAVAVPPSPQAYDDIGVVQRTHKRLYNEVLEVLADRFNQYARRKVYSSETYIEEFIAAVVPFLHKFYDLNQGTDPQTDEKFPLQQFEIKYIEDEEEDIQWIEFSCTVVQHTTGLYDNARTLTLKFYVK